MTAAQPNELAAKAREAARRTGRPTHTVPNAMPVLDRVGMGWEAKFPGDVVMRVTHLKERGGDFVGEIIVTCPDAGTLDGVVEWGTLNLLAGETRRRLAKRLDDRVQGDWSQTVDLFCREVVRLERMGPPVQKTDPTAIAKPLRYLLRPMLPYGVPTLLYGEGGTGKSTVAAAIAISVQTGTSVFPGWEIERSETSPVLVLDWEGTREVWQERINAVSKGAGLPPQAVLYRACRRRLVDDAEAIADAVLQANVNLVIVDAINQAFGVAGHEHADPAEMAIRAFSVIREVSGTDVTWLLIDHVTAENMRDTGQGVTPLKSYGSVSKQWLARQMFYLAAERDATEHRQELVLKQTKANYSWKLPPMGMVIRREADTIKFEFDEGVTAPELTGQLTITQRIETAVRDGAESPARIMELLGMNTKKPDRDAVSVTLGRMVRRGLLYKLPDGRYGMAAKVLQVDAFDGGGE